MLLIPCPIFVSNGKMLIADTAPLENSCSNVLTDEIKETKRMTGIYKTRTSEQTGLQSSEID